MNKKILFVSNIAGEKIGIFSFGSIRAAKTNGIEFHMAANFKSATKEQIIADENKYKIKLHHIDFARSPFNKSNLKAYVQLLKLVSEEKYDMIHCNTPVGGLIGRLVAKKCKVKKVIYQVHGFHFYKGAPRINWLLYYPIEKWLSHYTDILITINSEDYEFAQKKIKLRNHGDIYYVPGVGIELDKYKKSGKADFDLKKELKLNEDSIVCLSAGRLDANKNNATLIEAFSYIKNKDIHFIICGKGAQEKELKELTTKLNLENTVHFLGNREDMIEIYRQTDIFLMASYREGLSRSIMEAMASGLPCVVSDIRGNRDLIQEGQGGYLVKSDDPIGFARRIHQLEDPELRDQMARFNLDYIRKFDLDQIVIRLEEIYQSIE